MYIPFPSHSEECRELRPGVLVFLAELHECSSYTSGANKVDSLCGVSGWPTTSFPRGYIPALMNVSIALLRGAGSGEDFPQEP